MDLSPLKRTSTQKKLKKARSKMEHADIADKTVGGQKKWMDCKIKRDIEERKREPYDESKMKHLQVSLDCKAVTKAQLHG